MARGRSSPCTTKNVNWPSPSSLDSVGIPFCNGLLAKDFEIKGRLGLVLPKSLPKLFPYVISLLAFFVTVLLWCSLELEVDLHATKM